MADRFGASRAEWAHFAAWLGLTSDLLPVVSNPHAAISPDSTLKGIGKTPSHYNGARLVVGIPKWTQLRATAASIDAWQKEPDHGICLQTRSVRGIDIDIDDPALADAARALILEVLGLRRDDVPARGRRGSSRVVLGVAVDGPLGKRTIRVARAGGEAGRDHPQRDAARAGDGGASRGSGGLVELLADGQQFVVAGTHTSGARYEWEGGLPDSFPVVSRQALDAALAAVALRFGLPGEVSSCGDPDKDPGHRQHARLAGGGSPADGDGDPVVGWLRLRGFSRGPARTGEEYVHCPWAVDHTGDSGVSEAAWFPAGTGGYAAGHFKCLHAHCAHRTDAQFLDAVGFHLSVIDEAEVIHDDDDMRGGRHTGVADRRHPHAAVGRGDGSPPVGVVERVAHAPLSLIDGSARGVAAGSSGAGSSVGGAVGHAGNRGVVANQLGAVGRRLALPRQIALTEAQRDDPTSVWMVGTPDETLARGRRGYSALMRNFCRALTTPGWWRRLAYDSFRDEIVWCPWEESDRAAREGGPGGGGSPAWRRWADEDTTRARIALETAGFEAAGKEQVRDAVWLAAMADTFDSAQVWLSGLPAWDGVERMEECLVRYGGAEDSRYVRAVGAYLWTALAGRVLQPGVKADMVPVFHGRGGLRKSSFVAALAPGAEFAGKVALDERDADLARLMRGKLVLEIDELRGLAGRDSEAIKSFLSRAEDEWTPKYKELAVRHERRFLFVGTTDKLGVLHDDAGNLRRWLPVTLHGVLPGVRGRVADLGGLAAVREQLWAEGAARFAGGVVGKGGEVKPAGVAWEDAERLADFEADEALAAFVDEDPDAGALLDWAAEAVTPSDEDFEGCDLSGGGGGGDGGLGMSRGEAGFSIRGAMIGALMLAPGALKHHERRISNLLRRIGFEKRKEKSRGGGKRDRWLWFRT